MSNFWLKIINLSSDQNPKLLIKKSSKPNEPLSTINGRHSADSTSSYLARHLADRPWIVTYIGGGEVTEAYPRL